MVMVMLSVELTSPVDCALFYASPIDDKKKVKNPAVSEPTNYTSTYHTSRKCGGSHGTPSSRRTSSSVRGTGVPGCVS